MILGEVSNILCNQDSFWHELEEETKSPLSLKQRFKCTNTSVNKIEFNELNECDEVQIHQLYEIQINGQNTSRKLCFMNLKQFYGTKVCYEHFRSIF